MRRPTKPRPAAVGLVERGGKTRMFHVECATATTVREILVTNVDRKSTLNTDESRLYTVVGAEFGAHHTVITARTITARRSMSATT